MSSMYALTSVYCMPWLAKKIILRSYVLWLLKDVGMGASWQNVRSWCKTVEYTCFIPRDVICIEISCRCFFFMHVVSHFYTTGAILLPPPSCGTQTLCPSTICVLYMSLWSLLCLDKGEPYLRGRPLCSQLFCDWKWMCFDFDLDFDFALYIPLNK